jgi:hypothetical protein
LRLGLSLLAGLSLSVPGAVAAPALPPMRSAADALVQLALASAPEQEAALKNLRAACRGELRHELRDHAQVTARLLELTKSAAPSVKKAVFETDPCFTPPGFLALIEAGLADQDPAVLAAAAEAAARGNDPVLARPLLDAEEKHAGSGCTGDDALSKPELDACVWLAYAPGALLSRADLETRERAASLAAGMLASGHKKVREVAVETLAAAALKRYAADIDRLVAREEKPGGFKEPNDPSLQRHMKQRASELKKSGQ